MHTLIVGMTESGKTTLAKMLCRQLKKQGKLTAVLDPLLDDGWDTDFHTKDPTAFLTWAKQSRPCGAYLFIDEGAVSIGRYNEPMEWLATMSRHWGHSSHFITPHFNTLSPAVRNSCTRLYLFACASSVAKLAAIEFNQRSLLEGERLGKGQFYIVDRFAPIRRGEINFSEKSVIIVDIAKIRDNKRSAPCKPVGKKVKDRNAASPA